MVRRGFRRRDHPRSRGVYPGPGAVTAPGTGSSPLARGLPPRLSRPDYRTWIIPARAGFTCTWSRRRRGRRDHPRSRGVYWITHTETGVEAGSSPLARGLRRGPDRAAARHRIIPARAGFTLDDSGRCAARGDHPRSRGVYWISTTTSRPVLGIIPARAGFTAPGRLTRKRAGDHPRSRGVYSPPAERRQPGRGSSPLARGLRRVRWGPRDLRGIIPARAGFTSAPTSGAGRRRDHPRSRGVYAAAWAPTGWARGSSPLARGLRDQVAGVLGFEGIIPARAGFTRCPGSCRPGTADHPRSRGVYGPRRTSSSTRSGSSPLARGLRALTRLACEAPGIIPARAGFTAGYPAGRPPSWDHPRSRGVYAVAAALGDERPGSSPLARGLPERSSMSGIRSRIIPARAGFTPAATGEPGSPQDHPRSRGVYRAGRSRRSVQGGSSPLARGLPLAP